MSHLLQVMTTHPTLLSRPFPLRRLGDAPVDIRIDATADECAAIARAYDLPGLAALHGRFRLMPTRGGRIDLRLDLSARATRICVVSLDAFEQTIRERAALVLAPAIENDPGDAAPELLDPDAPDDIPIHGESVDLGALLAEQLALALDPYPRRPAAAPPRPVTLAEPEAPARSNPFSALAGLKPDRAKDDGTG